MKKFFRSMFNKNAIQEAQDKVSISLEYSKTRQIEDFHKYYTQHSDKWQQLQQNILENQTNQIQIFDIKEKYEKSMNARLNDTFHCSKSYELYKWLEELNQRKRALDAQQEKIEKFEQYLEDWQDDISERLNKLDKDLEIIDEDISKNNKDICEHKKLKNKYYECGQINIYYTILDGYNKNVLLMHEYKNKTILNYDNIIMGETDKYTEQEHFLRDVKEEYEKCEAACDREYSLFIKIWDRNRKAWEQSVDLDKIEIKRLTDALNKVTPILEADNEQRIEQIESIERNYKKYTPKIDGTLPKDSQQRREEANKIIFQANKIVTHWVQVGEIGTQIRTYEIDIRKLEFRDAAYQFGLHKDRNSKDEVKSQINILLQMGVAKSEIQELLNTWGFLGRFRPGEAINCEDRVNMRNNTQISNIDQNESFDIQQDKRTEQKKRELFFQNVRKQARAFGEAKYRWETANENEKNLLRNTFSDIRYSIKEYILSEIDRVAGGAVSFDFESSDIGEACKLPDED